MRVTMNSNDFTKSMNNLIQYSFGFLDGSAAGKQALMENIGAEVVEAIGGFIDSNARISPDTLHHIYEWHQTGSPEARLFDIGYRAGPTGISFNYTLRQSKSIKSGSKVPFYDKAKIMESGLPITIRPVNKKALAFSSGGEDVFVSGEVTVKNPGGEATTGAFEDIIDSFFNNYFSQSFLQKSGFISHLKDLKAYRDSLRQGIRTGKMAGYEAGKRWVAGKGGASVQFVST